MNEETVEHIKKWEDLRLQAYPDPGSKNGLPITIGYGTTLINGKAVPRNHTITPAQADQYLRADLPSRAKAVDDNVKVPLNDNQRGALISFIYNVGISAFKNSTLLKLLNGGNYDSVPSQLMRWIYNDGKEMKGLVNRRKAEIELWNTPVKKSNPVKKNNDAGTVAIIAAISGAILYITSKVIGS